MERCANLARDCGATAGQFARAGRHAGAGLEIARMGGVFQPGFGPGGRGLPLGRVTAPQGFDAWLDDTEHLERIRELRALLCFTRIQSNGYFAEATHEEGIRMTPIKRDAPTWLPA